MNHFNTTYLFELARCYGLDVVTNDPSVVLMRGQRVIAHFTVVRQGVNWHCTPLGAGAPFAAGREAALDDAVASAESFLVHKLWDTPPAEVAKVWGLEPSTILDRAAQGGSN